MPKPTRAHYGEFHPTRLSQNGKFPLMMRSKEMLLKDIELLGGVLNVITTSEQHFRVVLTKRQLP
jgi:hypothetical protein